MQNIYYVILFALKALIVTWLRPRDTGADIVTNWAVLDSLKNIWCPSLNRSRFLKSIRWTWSKENSLNIFLGGAFNIWVNLISGVANLLHFHSPWFDFVSSYSEKVLQGNKAKVSDFWSNYKFGSGPRPLSHIHRRAPSRWFVGKVLI